jgi:hypothetical protein
VTPADIAQIVAALTPVIRREVQAAMRPPSSWPTKRPFAPPGGMGGLMPGPMQAVVAGRIPLPYPLFDELVCKLGGERQAGEVRVREWAQERLLALPEGPVPGSADNYKWWRTQAEQTLFPKASRASTVAAGNDSAAADYLASLGDA